MRPLILLQLPLTIAFYFTIYIGAVDQLAVPRLHTQDLGEERVTGVRCPGALNRPDKGAWKSVSMTEGQGRN